MHNIVTKTQLKWCRPWLYGQVSIPALACNRFCDLDSI